MDDILGKLKYSVVPREILTVERVRQDLLKKAQEYRAASDSHMNNQNAGNRIRNEKNARELEEFSKDDDAIQTEIMDKYPQYCQNVLSSLQEEKIILCWAEGKITKDKLKALKKKLRQNKVDEAYFFQENPIETKEIRDILPFLQKYRIDYTKVPYFKDIIEVPDMQSDPDYRIYDLIHNTLDILDKRNIYEFIAEAYGATTPEECTNRGKKMFRKTAAEMREQIKSLESKYINDTDAKNIIQWLKENILCSEDAREKYDTYVQENIAGQKKVLGRMSGIYLEVKSGREENRYVFDAQISTLITRLEHVLKDADVAAGREQLYAKSLILQKIIKDHVQWILPWYYCNMAKETIQSNEYENNIKLQTAKEYLAVAQATYAKPEAIRDAREAIETYEQTIFTWVRAIQSCCQEKKFIEAQHMLQYNPGADASPYERQIREALAGAERIRREAHVGIGENQLFDIIARITQVCADYNVDDILSSVPPAMPENVTVRYNYSENLAEVAWSYPGRTERVEFVVVSSLHQYPSTGAGCQEYSAGSNLFYLDRNIPEGAAVYYGVYSKRGGIMSEITVCKQPAVIIYDVINPQVTENDGVVEATWENASAAEVRVYKKVENDFRSFENGDRVQRVSSTGFTDYDVVNEKTYRYLIQKFVRVNGTEYVSRGVQILATPDIQLSPPKLFDPRRDTQNRNLFRVKWQSDNRGEFAVYASDEKPRFETGFQLSGTQMLHLGRELSRHYIQGNEIVYDVPRETNVYLIPVTKRKSQGILGTVICLSNIDEMEIKDVRIYHDQLGVFLKEWPEEFSMLRVLYRFDRYPESEQDKNARMLKISRGEYLIDEVIKIPLMVKNYYIAIYGKYMDSSKGYSEGSYAFFKNQAKTEIFYQLKYKKRLFGGIKNVKIVFFLKDGKLTPQNMPIVMVWKNNGFLPMHMNYGSCVRTIFQADWTEEDGQLVCSLDGEFNEGDHINVFFQNTADNQKYVLKTERVADYKIG